MNNMIYASGKFEFNDFWQTLFWYHLKRKRLLIAIVAFIEFCGLITILAKGLTEIAVWGLVIPLVFVGLLIFQIYSVAKRSLKYNDKDIEWSFSITGYEVKTNSSSAKSEWFNFYQARETKDCFLLLPRPNAIQPIPKRFFSSVDDINQFRDILRFAFKDKAKLLN